MLGNVFWKWGSDLLPPSLEGPEGDFFGKSFGEFTSIF
jgi:hypothetical protein